MELEVPTTLSCDAGQTAVSAAVQHARQLSVRINVAVCGAPRLLVAFLCVPLSFPQSIERVSNPNGILPYEPLPRCPACYAPVKGVSVSKARKALSLFTLCFKATERCVLLTCDRYGQLCRGQFLPEARVTVSYGSRVRAVRGRLNRSILLVARTLAFLGYFFGLEARDVPMLEAERCKHGVRPRGKLSRQSKSSNLMIARLHSATPTMSGALPLTWARPLRTTSPNKPRACPRSSKRSRVAFLC